MTFTILHWLIQQRPRRRQPDNGSSSSSSSNTNSTTSSSAAATHQQQHHHRQQRSSIGNAAATAAAAYFACYCFFSFSIPIVLQYCSYSCICVVVIHNSVTFFVIFCTYRYCKCLFTVRVGTWYSFVVHVYQYTCTMVLFLSSFCCFVFVALYFFFL